jgi:hypothetical protein
LAPHPTAVLGAGRGDLTRRRGDTIGVTRGGPRAVRHHVSVRDEHSPTGKGPTGLPHSSHEKKEGNGLKPRWTTCPTNIAEFLSLDLGKE